MKFLALLVIILCLMPTFSIFKIRKVQNFPLSIEESDFKEQNADIYHALITGNKKHIKKDTLHLFKKYGTIHLLTPSGIHLSSLLIFIRSFPLLEIPILFTLYFYLSGLGAYLSMERVIIYRMLSKISRYISILKNPEINFLFVFFLSLLLGHYQKSALSLIYSIAFWGTIILFRDNKIKCLFHLNFILFFLGSLNYQFHSPLALIVNPAITSFMSFCFPILALNSLLPSLIQYNHLADQIISLFLKTHIFIDQINFFPNLLFKTELLFVFYLLILLKRKFLAFFILSFFYQAAEKPFSPINEKKYIRPNINEIFMPKKRDWYDSKNFKCKSRGLNFLCKKKALKKRALNTI